MRVTILQSGILLTLAALGTSAATAQTELYFATGVDSTGRALAQSNADGHVLIESPQYPRGLWLHLVDEAGDALAGLQVKYQERPDSLVAIRCVDLTAEVQETLVWTRAEGTPLSLTLKSREASDLPARVAFIDWQIDTSVESSLELVEEIRLIGWEEVAAFLREHWQGQAGQIAVQIQSSTTFTTLAVAVEHPETIETLVEHLQQTYRPAGTSLGKRTALYVQVFRVGLASLQQGVILYLPLFADANLERVVRQALGRPQARLTSKDVASLTKLSAISKDIHSLAGIEHLTALQSLNLFGNRITDISPLADLNNLNELYLTRNQIADISPLNQLNNLKTLGLSDNQIVDISPLNQLNNLNWLYLGFNQIIDLTPLNQLNNLSILELSDNQIADISPLNQLNNLNSIQLGTNQVADLTPLADLNNLNRLYLGFNQIADLAPLAFLTNLKALRLDSNRIVDLTPLNQLTNLDVLDLYENQITDLSPLVANTGLDSGDEVYLQSNPLSDQARNEQIPALEARGVTVTY